MLDTLRKDHERPDGITLVIGPLGEITVGRKKIVQLTDKTAFFTRFIGTIKRFVHQRIIAHGHTDHAHGRGRPGGMVVHLIEHLVVAAIAFQAVHQKVGHRTEQILLHIGTLGGGHIVVNAVIGHRGVYQPDAFVERLPEDAARGLREGHGMETQRRIEFGISRQHLCNTTGIFLLAGHLPRNAAVDHLVIVELMTLMRIASAPVTRLGHNNLRSHGGIGSGQRTDHHGIERRDLAVGFTHGGNALLREQQRGMLPGRQDKCRKSEQKGQKQLFHRSITFFTPIPNCAGRLPARWAKSYSAALT